MNEYSLGLADVGTAFASLGLAAAAIYASRALL